MRIAGIIDDAVNGARMSVIAPLVPHFGVEAHHAVLSEPEMFRELLVRHGLVLVRRVVFDDTELAAFGRQVGNGRLELSARSRSHSRTEPAVSNLTNLLSPDGEPIGYGNDATDYWHSDQEFRVEPATIGLLYCFLPPESGGQTTFASTDVDHLGIDRGTISQLEKAQSRRRPAPAYDHDLAPQVLVSHSALLTHHGSQRRTLYISELAFDLNIAGEMLSPEVLSGLLAAVTAQPNTYCHNWKQGDLLVFDNTQLIHRREAFSGSRWLKSVKIFASQHIFTVPCGTIVEHLQC
ncbi:MAG: TauD/TfdA family dioxygenase [Acidobacteriota bacterium]|nr:TauD/TfdA family dioxygenase [Acidobacteriota bacterium]